MKYFFIYIYLFENKIESIKHLKRESFNILEIKKHILMIVTKKYVNSFKRKKSVMEIRILARIRTYVTMKNRIIICLT